MRNRWTLVLVNICELLDITNGFDPVKGDYDICQCGDFRHQHEDGTGWCRMPNDVCHGFQPCLRFRLEMRVKA